MTVLHSVTVAEPPELSRLKCAGHHHKGNIDSNALQTEKFLVCRVTSRYNHRFLDRTSIPRTKVSPEILQPYIFYNTGIVVITRSLKHYYRSKLSKALYKTILLVQTPRVSQPSPLKGISPRDYRKKGLIPEFVLRKSGKFLWGKFSVSQVASSSV